MCHFLGIYKCTFTHKKLGIPKEHLAGKSLPHLVSLSIENNLNLNQVKTHIHSTHKLFLFIYRIWTWFSVTSAQLYRFCSHIFKLFCVSVFQFNAFMAVIREMMNRMEAEHKTKLEQLHIMQEQQRCHFNYFSVYSFLKCSFINKRFCFCIYMTAVRFYIELFTFLDFADC